VRHERVQPLQHAIRIPTKLSGGKH
jgi:hypothetical protein